MRKINFVVIIIGIALTLGACYQSPKDPAWTKHDLGKAKNFVESIGGPFAIEEKTILTKPPFYEGIMPLKFTAHLINIGDGMVKPKEVVLCDDYGEWKVVYFYRDAKSMYENNSDGAVAISRGHHIMADARVRKKFDSEKHLIGLEIREAHYNRQGDITFESVFEIDQSTGFKTRELTSHGKKEKEYFFIWSSHP